MGLQRGVGEGIPHRRDKKEAASKFRTFKGQQFLLAWSRRLGSPVFRPAIYRHQVCCTGWASYTHLLWERSGGVDPGAPVRLVPPSRHLVAPMRLLCLVEMIKRVSSPLFFPFIPDFFFIFYSVE
jgi:hypothetical protein